MSRNAMDACIDAANERDEQRETARREWLESVQPAICPSCDGTGDAYIPRDGRMAARCPACKGAGAIEVTT